MKTLILGIGNLLLCDEGVGVHAVRALQQEGLPPNVTALEVGTALLDALPEIEQADRIIIIDAMKADHGPGTVYRVPLSRCLKPDCMASMHGFDISRVLFLAGRTSISDVIVIGVEPARIGWGTDPSPQVRDTIPAVVKIVMTEIAGHDSHQQNTRPLSQMRSASIGDHSGDCIGTAIRDSL